MIIATIANAIVWWLLVLVLLFSRPVDAVSGLLMGAAALMIILAVERIVGCTVTVRRQ